MSEFFDFLFLDTRLVFAYLSLVEDFFVFDFFVLPLFMENLKNSTISCIKILLLFPVQ